MLEAMWTVRFAGSNGIEAGSGGGVIVFESGRMFGGDTSFAYLGTYTVEQGKISAKIKVDRHGTGLHSITGLENFSLILRGTIDQNQFDVVGHVEGRPERTLAVRLQRFAELP